MMWSVHVDDRVSTAGSLGVWAQWVGENPKTTNTSIPKFLKPTVQVSAVPLVSRHKESHITAILYHGGRTVMYPHKQGQYSNHPPYTLGHTGWSLKFHDLLLGPGKEELSSTNSGESPLLPRYPSDATPTGGYIAWVSRRVSAAYCQVARMVSTWGAEAKVQSLRSDVRI